MTDSFQKFVNSSRTPLPPQLVKDGEPQDDPARPESYQAVRRIRSFPFTDVVFRRYTGASQAFPWHNLRSWMTDERGERMMLLWPEAAVTLTGRNLDRIEEDIMRRIVAEFRQLPPGQALPATDEKPVIMTIEIAAMDHEHGISHAA